MLHRTLILTAFALASAGCTTRLKLSIPDQGGTVLSEQRADGTEVVYKLHPGTDGAPTINRYATRTIRRATLGIRVADIDGDLSKRISALPGKGLYVESVTNGGPAARGGLLEGDILLSLRGTPLASAAQLGDILAHAATPGVAIPLQIERPAGGAVHSILDLTVVPDGKDEPATDNEAFALRAIPDTQRHTGLQVTELPTALAHDIYGAPGSLMLVSGVITGSPAYLAGVRRGDVIQSCDGLPVTTAAVLTRALDQRLGRAEAPESVGPGTPLELRVKGQLGLHETEVELTDDLDQSTHFRIPILCSYQSDLSSTRWSFLDFIFQFGGNYSTMYTTANSREPASHTSLSLFPFGMFEFDLSPQQNRYTILWFIRWTRSH